MHRVAQGNNSVSRNSRARMSPIMKPTHRIVAPLIFAAACCAGYDRTAAADPSKLRYDGSWESLQRMPVPAWFDDGKIGIFIHWGPYSAIGYRKGGRGYAEHVPKMLYAESDHYYPYMKKRWGATPPEFGYKDIIPEFKAENWNPGEWADLFAEVGARYVVLTAEHHDGWANWDSDLTPWNAVDKGPKRDLVGDLGKAVRQRGLKYAPSYHRERHTGFFAQTTYAVHSEPRPDIVEEIRACPRLHRCMARSAMSKPSWTTTWLAGRRFKRSTSPTSCGWMIFQSTPATAIVYVTER